MDPATIGWWGGLGGGLLGCYCSIRNTNGPRERRLMIGASGVCLAAVALFLGALRLTPQPYRPLLWLPYSLLLPWGIRVINRRQVEARAQDAMPGGDGAGRG